MTRVAAAIDLLRECESEIRGLIELALSERRYEEISALAELAAALAALAAPTPSAESDGHVEGRPPGVPGPLKSEEVRATTRRTKAKGARPPAGQYPRFERRSDRLVKIGWSKADRSEYEHKASRGAVRSVLKKLGESSGETGYFKLDDVLPVTGADGAEVPSYQAYLVVAWLRELGVIERLGNEGYRLVNPTDDALDIDQLWGLTPEGR